MANSLSRIEKLEKLTDPYPRDFPGRETIDSLLSEQFFNDITHLTNKPAPPIGKVFKIAGRISARRGHKDNIFFDIFDQTGSIQLHAQNDASEQPNKKQEVFSDVLECDIGDMIGVEGTIGANPRGEPLLLISNFTTLAKALKDPPANFHGVKNPELKYRHREVDLLSSADSREVFKKRAKIVFEIRKYLNDRDFVEIECPVLQPIYGGATARPFKTSHNSLGQDFFLSISSELYLKRAMVGGFDRVYSFSRCFRNEGISPEHNPEFTNLEIFETCKTSQDMHIFTNNIINYLGEKFNPKNPAHSSVAKENLPSSDWPLSRKCGNLAEAWELYINDMEIASGASDLNDPREQENRFLESESHAGKTDAISSNKSEINPETIHDPLDINYIEALEMGALPWAGVGIGIDRLCMLLLNKKNIRDVVIFPTLKNEK
jgi:lysyl-tRNA synthetase class II